MADTWEMRQAHYDAVRPVWIGPAKRGRVWNQRCRDRLEATGHTSLGYDNCACRVDPIMFRKSPHRASKDPKPKAAR